MGKNLIYVSECHSTNDFAIKIAQQPSMHEGTVVITDNQTKGRGQRTNQWLTEPGKNLTLSILLCPSFLLPREQFFLNKVISLALYDLLRAHLDKPVFIKWPNDIIVDDRKVSGILIENQLRGNAFLYSIVGIGLNVNQDNFSIPGATSLTQITGRQFHLPTILDELLERVEVRYLALRNGKMTELQNDYINALYWYNITHSFSFQEKTFQGIIRGVDRLGKLIIEVKGVEHFYDLKEVKYLK